MIAVGMMMPLMPAHDRRPEPGQVYRGKNGRLRRVDHVELMDPFGFEVYWIKADHQRGPGTGKTWSTTWHDWVSSRCRDLESAA